jgi:hypothetical protein
MRPLMRWILLLSSLVAGCDASTITNSDFGVVLPGCRGPSACWKVNCPCNYAAANDSKKVGVTQSPDQDPNGCLVCDPTKQLDGVCDCSTDGGVAAVCQERAEVCVGSAATTCDGLCVRRTSVLGCMDPNAEPPNQVASVVGGDGGPGTEKRCPFADDICCD